MGMFDHVAVEMDCPFCGHRLDDFQSKDGPCYLGLVSPETINNFYTDCPVCGNWVEFSRPGPEEDENPSVMSREDVEHLGFELVRRA